MKDFTSEMEAPHIAEVMMDEAKAASIRDRLEFHIQQAGGYDDFELESVDEAIALCERLQKKPSQLGLLCLETFLRELPALRRTA
ncbi:hypothetical protein FACS189479_06850 [Spirochaetia bacterium]|nr:hypothetical protein FACS189479_06850 [Spirochaetia bacterium]